MDKLEQRLKQLKNSYEEIPTTSQASKILENVKKTEIKTKKKWAAQLPYVASFMGVLIIGSILVIQLLFSQDPNTASENPTDKPSETDVTENVEKEEVTEEQIDAKHKELVQYYNAQKQGFEHTELNIPVAEDLSYIQEVKQLVDATADPGYREYRNLQELDESFEEYRKIVQDAFEMPKTDYVQIDEKVKKGEDVSSDVMNIIRKQVELLESFSKLANYEKYNKISPDLDEQEKKLNSLQVEDPDLLTFAREVKDNGYHFFVHVEGEINIEINYQLYLDQYEKNMNTSVAEFVQMKTKRLLLEGSINATWDELAERLVRLEVILANYDGPNKDLIKREYNEHLDLYLSGSFNTWAFDPYNGKLEQELGDSYEKFLIEHKGTETFKIINEYYALLKNGNFNREAVAEFSY
jgi:hypothetical protein